MVSSGRMKVARKTHAMMRYPWAIRSTRPIALATNMHPASTHSVRVTRNHGDTGRSASSLRRHATALSLSAWITPTPLSSSAPNTMIWNTKRNAGLPSRWSM